jgi:hypothetical protein
MWLSVMACFFDLLSAEAGSFAIFTVDAVASGAVFNNANP